MYSGPSYGSSVLWSTGWRTAGARAISARVHVWNGKRDQVRPVVAAAQGPCGHHNRRPGHREPGMNHLIYPTQHDLWHNYTIDPECSRARISGPLLL
ncbi:unnamed protein product [Heligmosomoides polygyrus]|uniref:Secreted protein n=1 Tax=Heligmosomoides polygyrus TaxID=6339 RepID=A0A183FFT7_HELPZ|nr:unnamed protein product [Heligmosomoides polygyrus]